MKQMNNLAQEIHNNNIKKGFYEDEKNIGEMLCLVHSEVSEALESHRKDVNAKLERFVELEPTFNKHHEKGYDKIWKEHFELLVKDSFEDEIADAIIRLLDLCAFKGIDIEKHVELKMKYNSLRPYKHGKKY